MPCPPVRCLGLVLGEGTAGPANIRMGVDSSMRSVLDATGQCLAEAKLSISSRPIIACLALAGATEPIERKAIETYRHPFRQMMVTTDAHAACVGAHRGEDGGIIIIGTGTVAWAMLAGRSHRVGGWGFPVSDEGSGGWLGCEVVRRVLWAYDGRAPWTGLLRCRLRAVQLRPHAIVRWMSVGEAARVCNARTACGPACALRRIRSACELMQLAARTDRCAGGATGRDRRATVGAGRRAVVEHCADGSAGRRSATWFRPPLTRQPVLCGWLGRRRVCGAG